MFGFLKNLRLCEIVKNPIFSPPGGAFDKILRVASEPRDQKSNHPFQP